MGGGLGLLLLIATFMVNMPGASAHTRTTCSGNNHTYSVVGGDTLSGIGYCYGSVLAMINQVFGPYGPEAINVAMCESGLNPGASNPSGAAGLFQIMPGIWAGTSEAGQSPYNASANIAAADQIFVRDGYSWREWTCKP